MCLHVFNEELAQNDLYVVPVASNIGIAQRNLICVHIICFMFVSSGSGYKSLITFVEEVIFGRRLSVYIIFLFVCLSVCPSVSNLT